MDSWIRPGTSVNRTGFRRSPAFLEISNLISISFSGKSSLEKDYVEIKNKTDYSFSM
jgi:hypothetical protein